MTEYYCRISEIVLNVVGAKQTTDNPYLQLRVESSGDFQGRGYGNTYNFVTSALSLAFESDINTSMYILSLRVVECHI